MRALWDSPLRTSGLVSIAEPLAYLSDLRLLVQGPVREEQTLEQLLVSALHAGTPEAMAELESYVRKTAVGLAALHRSGVTYGETVTWADELADVRKEIARLTVPMPDLADVVTTLLAHLEALDAAYPADPPLPAHGSFRPAQVLLHGAQIGFIDFDSFCRAEPAMDLAQFRATVTSAGLSGALSDEDEDEGEDGTALPDRAACLARLAQLEPICEAFLASYQAFDPVSRPRVALWETLYVLAKVLHGWTKVKPARIYLRMLLLERHLEGLWLTVPATALSSRPTAV
jgi:aminoglycoside phosphotransferase (APT) family kinase protein